VYRRESVRPQIESDVIANRLLSFHAIVHARAAEVSPGVSLSLRGVNTSTLVVAPSALAYPFNLSFEQVFSALESIERMYIEPDGSFVWVSSASAESDSPQWQLDGNLFDRNGRLLLVDVKGCCTEQVLDRLLSAVGWPEIPVMFELAREAVFLDESAFRQYAARAN
jgi:hypothetical protein